MDKKKLYTLFEGDFPGIQTFLAEVICPIFGSCTNENENILCTPEALKRAQVANIKSIIQVGTLDETLNSHIIYVYDITLVDNVHIAYSRSNIQQYIRRHEFPFTHAFMLFHYKDSKDKEWRFSYCFKQNTLVESTSAKRFTYLFGKGHRGKTAVERLEILANSDKTDQDLENAFSVEALSDSFFKEYKQFYEAFVEYITGYRYVKKGCKWENTYIHEPDPQFANFKNNQKLVRDYIKKMLGRIVFLYFIQRKGWLNDDSNYMENLFLDSSDEQKNNFLDSVLKPLFFGLLNTLPKDRATIYINNVSPATLPGHKTIPYLNGGLFQQEEIDKCQLQFRADLFDGLFKFLGSYNFTIDENDPDDVEIGIDPEMLGCIFENLLEDNRDKGAYYTPKEIVHYMCRESLIAYLQTDKNNEEKDQIKRFVTNHNAQELREQVSDIDKKRGTCINPC